MGRTKSSPIGVSDFQFSFAMHFFFLQKMRKVFPGFDLVMDVVQIIDRLIENQTDFCLFIFLVTFCFKFKMFFFFVILQFLVVQWMVKSWVSLSIPVIARKRQYHFQLTNSHIPHRFTTNATFDCVHFKILNVNR